MFEAMVPSALVTRSNEIFSSDLFFKKKNIPEMAQMTPINKYIFKSIK